MNRVSLTITRGDDRTWPISVATKDGPIDLTGATFESTLRKEYTSTILGHPTIAVVDAANGKLEMTISNQLSALLQVQSGKRQASYVFDVVLSLNTKDTTYINGYIVAEERVSPVGAP